MKHTVRSLLIIAAIEKFIINGLRAGFIIYLIKVAGFKSTEAMIKGTTFMALSYLMPLACGLLIERLPKLKSELFSLGYLCAPIAALPLLFPSFGLDIFVGMLLAYCGFVKVIVPLLLKEQIGNESDASVFTNLYSAFNLGTIIGAVSIAILGEWLSWKFSFASISMATALIAYIGGSHNFSLGSVFSLLMLGGFAALGMHDLNLGATVVYVLLAFSVFIAWRTYSAEEAKSKIVMFLILLVTHTLFFAFYEQAATSFVVLAEKAFTNKSIALPVTTFNLFDPALNVILGFVFVTLWKKPILKNIADSYLLRFALGFAATVPALFLLRMATEFESLTSCLSYFFAGGIFWVTAEQFIVPAGFSFITNSTKSSSRATMLGVWYCGVSFSEKVAGWLGLLLIGNLDQLDQIKNAYTRGTNIMIMAAIILSILLALLGINLLFNKSSEQVRINGVV